MSHDRQLQESVLAELNWEPSITAAHIGVTAYAGVITLTSHVDTLAQKYAAENVRTLFGVIDISNQIAIKPHVDTSDMSTDIAQALYRTWYFEPEAIKVNAVGGKVILTGNVHSLHDWDVARSVAWCAPGTTVVQNEISIA